jgi:hypothetical protein
MARKKKTSSPTPTLPELDAIRYKDSMRFTNRILMAVVRSPRADPSVSRRPQHGRARRQTA